MEQYRSQIRPMMKLWKQRFEETFPGKDWIILALFPESVSEKSVASLTTKLKSDLPIAHHEKYLF